MKKKLLLFTLALFAATQAWGQSINIIESTGWFESVYVTWDSLSNAKRYSVYYKEATAQDSDYKKIDDTLIRKYKDASVASKEYYRADAVGLKAGNYILKIVPLFKEDDDTYIEDASKQSVTGSVTVAAYDRSGFAFTNGGAPGAYKTDGTLKDGAKIVYLTANTAKTVKLNVVTDTSKGTTETGTGIYEILKLREKNKAETTPLVIRVIGLLTASDVPSEVVSDTYIDLKNTQNVTVEGIGNDATAFSWGVHVRNSSNIEVRNLAFMRFGDDGVSLEVGNSNIWLHNNDFFYGKQGSGDKAKGDGALDVKTSALVTVSYNHFWDSGKANLLGNGTEPEEYLTYHHNWYDHSDSRHPRVRCHSVHVYNNYYSNIAKYGIGSTMASSIFSEANYFEYTSRPMTISMQGSDSGTFSSEAGGIIKAYNNYLDAFSSSSFTPYSTTNTVEFDAYVVENRNDQVPTTVTAKKGGAKYNNFDTNSSIMYSYTPDTPTEARTKVMQYAGRMLGGDFQPTGLLGSQSDSDDPLAGLSAAIDSYTTNLIYIQGDGTSIVTPPDTVTIGGKTHSFTELGNSSTFYSITGSITSGSGGSVEVNGETLTKYLKMESATKVSFTTDSVGVLTLVFNAASSKTVKINSTTYTIPDNGIFTMDLPIGSYVIEKGTSNTFLFFISVVYDDDSSSISDNEKIQFTLYPNPVVNNLYISSDINVESVEIYSISGNRIQQINGNVNSIDMSNLNAGSYIVNVRTGEGSYKQIIIKK